jgi:arylsulfatase A-like enzyme
MTRFDRRSFLKSAGVCALATALRGQQTAARPNIVYVLADDLGWGDLPCYNPGSAIPMPNADRLAAQGVRFTDMHSPSAVCTPTRYGILTGRYCWRSRLKSGVLWGYDRALIEDGRLTVPGLLKQAGYATAGIGKWHLGLGGEEKTDYTKPLRPGPVTHGFDEYFGIPASLDMEPYVYFENDRVVEPPTAHTEGKNHPRGVFYRPGPMAPSFRHEEVLPTLTRKAVEFIQERAKRPEQPFFLYFPLPSPHTPWLPTDAVRGRSRAGDYGDFVAQTDDALGAVMQVLDETGLAENTLLIFTSDNGADWKIEDKEKFAHRANAHWKGEKADVWEGGHRVPFLARWPGRIPAGSVRNELGCLTDLMATVAAISGLPLPQNAAEDSENLLQVMIGSAEARGRDAVVHHSINGTFSLRQGDWKLVLGLGSGGFTAPQEVPVQPGGPEGQLFHLAEDPREENNLWQRYPEVVERLKGVLRKIQSEGRSRRS